jgi:hypothetical protein
LGVARVARRAGAFRFRRSQAKVVENVVVWEQPGRFGGWPANHGIWSYRTKPGVDGLGRSLDGGRLVVIYGYRSQPWGIRARFSSDQGKTWGEEFKIRPDGPWWDLGYPRSVERSDGKIVTIYYFMRAKDTERYIAATIWDPGTAR